MTLGGSGFAGGVSFGGGSSGGGGLSTVTSTSAGWERLSLASTATAVSVCAPFAPLRVTQSTPTDAALPVAWAVARL
jgi:hypothetical protein